MSQKHKHKKARKRQERIRLDKAAGRAQNQLAKFDKTNEPIPVKPTQAQVYKAEDFVRRDDKPWPTISACLMVRDEEENMVRVLDSVVDVVDEIIIIDTGSVDRTFEIIQDHRAWPMVKWSHEPWQNDFSFHRNHTFEKATCDWILYIDADEELIFEGDFDLETLKIMLQNLRDDCAAVLIDLRDYREGNMVGQHSIHRLLKAGRTYFQGIVHNTLILNNPDDTVTYCGRLVLNHYGYSASEARESKFDRTEKLLLKQLDIPEENLHTHFYLAELYGMRHDSEKLIKHARAYLAQRGDSRIRNGERVAKGFFSAIYYPLAKHLLDLGKLDEVPRIIREGLQECPHDLDLLNLLSMLGIKQKDQDVIALAARAFCKAYAGGEWKKAKVHPVFTASQAAFALNLYRLIIVRLDQLCSNFKAFIPVLDSLKEEEADEFLRDVGANVTKSGLLPALNVLPIDLPKLIKPPKMEAQVAVQ